VCSRSFSKAQISSKNLPVRVAVFDRNLCFSARHQQVAKSEAEFQKRLKQEELHIKERREREEAERARRGKDRLAAEMEHEIGTTSLSFSFSFSFSFLFFSFFSKC
jgi:hypothetical protein